MQLVSILFASYKLKIYVYNIEAMYVCECSEAFNYAWSHSRYIRDCMTHIWIVKPSKTVNVGYIHQIKTGTFLDYEAY